MNRNIEVIKRVKKLKGGQATCVKDIDPARLPKSARVSELIHQVVELLLEGTENQARSGGDDPIVISVHVNIGCDVEVTWPRKG